MREKTLCARLAARVPERLEFVRRDVLRRAGCGGDDYDGDENPLHDKK